MRPANQRATPAGFEPALPKEMPNLLCVHIAGHRVNHSAKAPWIVEKLVIMLVYIQTDLLENMLGCRMWITHCGGVVGSCHS